MAEHLDAVEAWDRSQITSVELATQTGWDRQMESPTTYRAAELLSEALDNLGAAMAADARSGVPEDQILQGVGHLLPVVDGSKLLGHHQVLHEALDVLEPWLARGQVALFQERTRLGFVLTWDNEGANARRIAAGEILAVLGTCGLELRNEQSDGAGLPLVRAERRARRYVRIVAPGHQRVRIADAASGKRERTVNSVQLHPYPMRGAERRTGYAHVDTHEWVEHLTDQALRGHPYILGLGDQWCSR